MSDANTDAKLTILKAAVATQTTATNQMVAVHGLLITRRATLATLAITDSSYADAQILVSKAEANYASKFAASQAADEAVRLARLAFEDAASKAP